MSTSAYGSTTELESWRERTPPYLARYTDLIVTHGSGSWVYTTTGRRLLDYSAGIGVTSVGHSHPRVVAAIAKQAAEIIHAQQNIFHHAPGLALHSRLPAKFPGAKEDIGMALSSSGAEAIETALKFAKMATRRSAIVAFRGGFHGRTHAAMSITSSGVQYRGHYEPLLPSVYFVPYPDPLRQGGPGRSVDVALHAIETLFSTLVHPDDVAAFVVEPILGEGGYIVPPDDFLPALATIARRHSILLVVDEIQSGIGRTGRFFATEHSGALPDIVVFGKGIAAGMPLAGVLASRRLLETIDKGSHGGTYGGNPVACAAAMATLDIIDEPGFLDAVSHRGVALMDGLRHTARAVPTVAEVRGRGLMVGIEFADPDTLKPRPDLARGLIDAALRRDLVLLQCGSHGQVVRVVPPLTTTLEEIDDALQRISLAFEDIATAA